MNSASGLIKGPTFKSSHLQAPGPVDLTLKQSASSTVTEVRNEFLTPQESDQSRSHSGLDHFGKHFSLFFPFQFTTALPRHSGSSTEYPYSLQYHIQFMSALSKSRLAHPSCPTQHHSNLCSKVTTCIPRASLSPFSSRPSLSIPSQFMHQVPLLHLIIPSPI